MTASLFMGLMISSCTEEQPQTVQEVISDAHDAIPDSVNSIEPVALDLIKIKERGALVAIVDNSTTSYFIYKGQPMGYEYELLSMLAEELGVELKLLITRDINDAFSKLLTGEGDIIAYNLTITKRRAKKIAFTDHLILSRQVLVQKKPDNWRKMKLHQIEKTLIRNQVDLIGKEVHVRGNSSFVSRLKNLSSELGGDIIIVEEPGELEVEKLIQNVSDGSISMTVADENVAKINATYHKNLDVKTPVSFPQRIAWGLRPSSPELLSTTNNWLKKAKMDPAFNTIYGRYFKRSKASLKRVQSDYSTITTNHLSPYDSLIKKGAQDLGWDWELLASLIFQESKFNPKAKSWVGAKGLMQLMPPTAKQFGATNPEDPRQGISAGVKYLKWLNEFWKERVPDENERIKFILGSYNVGQGHILDARKLCVKHGKDSTIWEDNVEYFLLKKSEPAYYNDPVVTSGYCRGGEPVNYVIEILHRAGEYRQLMSEQPVLSTL